MLSPFGIPQPCKIGIVWAVDAPSWNQAQMLGRPPEN